VQLLDFIVLFLYLIIVSYFSLWASGKQASTKSFFLAEKSIPWWMIMFSVVATETSVLTFLSIPGIAYNSNFGFLQLALGYVIGRWLVAHYLLPLYFKEGLESTYEFLRNRWGVTAQRTGSFVFQVTRILSDGVRLFMTAIPMTLITGWSYQLSIIVIVAFTLFYTILGGLKAVVWADSIQFSIYIIGGFITIWVLGIIIDGGWISILRSASNEDKLLIFQGGNFLSYPYHFITAFFGGIFLSLASHGTDHLMVQRLLSAKSLNDSRKALIGSGVLALFQFGIFLMIGTGIWAFYEGETINSNNVFSKFIIDALPIGVKGLIVAAIFSAAMSSLSSSINAIASSIMSDWIKLIKPNKYNLRNSRLISIICGIVISISALLFTSSDNPLVEIGLTISSFTYGGLLGFFVLGLLNIEFSSLSVILGFISSIIIMILIIVFTPIAWPWYTLIGLTLMIMVSTIVRLLKK
tara:strand:+ start:30384 stop:31781 length:1398 start_codon:yes stop_codon:yes gene_type:complete